MHLIMFLEISDPQVQNKTGPGPHIVDNVKVAGLFMSHSPVGLSQLNLQKEKWVIEWLWIKEMLNSPNVMKTTRSNFCYKNLFSSK